MTPKQYRHHRPHLRSRCFNGAGGFITGLFFPLPYWQKKIFTQRLWCSVIASSLNASGVIFSAGPALRRTITSRCVSSLDSYHRFLLCFSPTILNSSAIRGPAVARVVRREDGRSCCQLMAASKWVEQRHPPAPAVACSLEVVSVRIISNAVCTYQAQ